jgi:hypothetical protein
MRGADTVGAGTREASPAAPGPGSAGGAGSAGARAPRHAKGSSPSRGSSSGRARSLEITGAAFAGYLVLSIVMWWGAWSTHPTSVTSCSCGDASLFLWFLEWPAYAIAHGHNPFYSTAMFHPAGIDLLSNTSVLAVGIVLAPVTWLFGPIATMNVASTLGPALSALAMFWLLRRWVSWTPAAFLGGLLFGFSPFLLVNVAGGHLMTSVLVLVPLIVACLDEMLVTQERSALRSGVILGVLVALQFFISTEVLMITAICSVAGLVVLGVAAAVADRDALLRRVPHAARSLGTTAVVAAILLAYPVWFALDGPAHLSGLVWPTLIPGAGGISLSNLWHLNFQNGLRDVMQIAGGYEGPALPQAEYLGLGIFIVLTGGLVIWRKDRRLWFLAVMGAVGVVLSLGVNVHHWVPWELLLHVPIIQNIIPARFMIVVTLCAGGMTAIVVDRTYGSVSGLTRRLADGRLMPRGTTLVATATATTFALVVAAVALVPVGTAVATNMPLTTQSEQLPAWFAKAAPHLEGDQVVLAYPAPFALVQSALAWQAVDLLHFAMAGGSGPESVPQRAGRERVGFEVLTAASFSVIGSPEPSATNIEAVRRALVGWGVTVVVVPNPEYLPRYDQGTSPATALGLFTLAIGRVPRYVDRAWVWMSVERLSPRRAIANAAFDHCSLKELSPGGSLAGMPDCVLSASRRAP